MKKPLALAFGFLLFGGMQLSTCSGSLPRVQAQSPVPQIGMVVQYATSSSTEDAAIVTAVNSDLSHVTVAVVGPGSGSVTPFNVPNVKYDGRPAGSRNIGTWHYLADQ